MAFLFNLFSTVAPIPAPSSSHQSINRSAIHLDEVVLGRGGFGVVSKGRWLEVVVAVKTLREISPSVSLPHNSCDRY